jgi:hypothetical protein
MNGAALLFLKATNLKALVTMMLILCFRSSSSSSPCARARERERERVRKKKVAERGKIGKTSTNFFLLSFYPHKHTRIYTYI